MIISVFGQLSLALLFGSTPAYSDCAGIFSKKDPLPIIVIEDDSQIRDVFESAGRIPRFQVAVTAVAGANEALGLRDFPFDTAFIDYNLGSAGSGLDLAIELKRRYPHLNIVIISGLPFEVPEGMRFEQKPFNIVQLLSSLRTPK